MTRTEWVATGAAASYLLLLGAAMQYTTYDTWGALVIVPVIVVVSGPIISRMFSGRLAPFRRLAWGGLVAKLLGGYVGYVVRVDGYRSGDALRYDRAGKQIAGDVWNGSLNFLDAIPTSTGTEFLEEFTGFVYVFVGSSRLAGFLVFSWFSYLGLLFFVKAAASAVPDLERRRYAALVFFLPSIVYWGSSIGKEAVIGLFLGVGAYGAAMLLQQQRRGARGATFLAIGVAGSAMVRPHFAGLLIGAAMIAVVVRLAVDLRRQSRIPGAQRSKLTGSVALVVVAVVAFVGVANIVADEFSSFALDSDESVTDQLSSILNETSRRTSKEGGSAFQPLTINGPADFPYAAARTLTRPLITDVRGVSELLPALEMGALLALGLVNWRRFAHVPKLMFTTPYVMFALVFVFTFGVAFTSIGNTGILVRQRSLILPLFLLFWCLPPLPRRSFGTPTLRHRVRATADRIPAALGR